MTELLTYKQAAALSGLSEVLLREKASRRTPPKNRLPVHRFGHRTVRIARSALEKWMKTQ